VKLIVELDDATDTGRLHALLDDLAAHRPYVLSALVVTDEDEAA
jgi:hypothetical protein